MRSLTPPPVFASTHPQSLRAWLGSLERGERLLRITDAVDPAFEIAGALVAADGSDAVLFENVDGSSLPVVGNTLPDRAAFATAIGAANDRELQARVVAAIDAPLDTRTIANAPAQHISVENPVLLDELPVPHFFEREAGRYITAGAIVARDAASGRANCSFARIMPLGDNRAFIGIAPNHHLAVLLRRQPPGVPLPIAVTIGNHPAVMLAACLYLGLGDDELRVAGALLGGALEVAQTANGLSIPAHAEIVLEGTLDATAFAAEERVSEYHGMYESYGPGVVATFSRLTRRDDAVFQTILPGYHQEHCLLGGIAIAAGLARSAHALVSSVREVAVGMGGAGRLHAVVTLHEPLPGEARKAMFALWAAVNLIKRIVVVDDDIDPWNPEAVEWAIATRMHADRDLVVVPGVRADRSEPLEAAGVIAKLGIDATRRSRDRPDWSRAQPPAAASASGATLVTSARAVRARAR